MAEELDMDNMEVVDQVDEDASENAEEGNVDGVVDNADEGEGDGVDDNAEEGDGMVDNAEEGELSEMEDDGKFKGLDDNDDIFENGSEDGEIIEQHEFEIIDEVSSAEEDDKELEGGSERKKDEGDGDSSGSELDDSRVHELLEQGIDKDTLGKKKDGPRDQPVSGPLVREKIVLEILDSDPFDILPEGWVCTTHNSGMPLYLHRDSRVCTMSKPYHIGNASTRNHSIPISAIPCMQYRQQLDKLKVKESDSAESKKSSEEKATLFTDHASPQKMWMVTQDLTSRSSPSSKEHEELHTGQDNFISEIPGGDSNSLFCPFAMPLSGLGADGCPQSPGGENIAVTLQSSTSMLDDLDDDDDEECGGAGEEKPICEEDTLMDIAITSRELDKKNQDVDIKPDIKALEKLVASQITSSQQDSTTISIVASEENLTASRESISNTQSSDILHDSKPISNVPLERISTCGDTADCKSVLFGNFLDTHITDKSSEPLKNVVSEETAPDTDSSELVTSGADRLSVYKRKLEDWKRQEGKEKQIKLDDSVAAAVVAAPEEETPAPAPDTEKSVAADTNEVAADTDDPLKLKAVDVKVRCADDIAKDSLLTSEMVYEYCQQLFRFKTITVKKYKTWSDRKKFLKIKKVLNKPELPSNTKLITCTLPPSDQTDGGKKNGKAKEFFLNPSGKSHLSILHEYLQRALKVRPVYVFKEIENSQTPYSATVTINDIKYGTGCSSSKKQAKQEAAKETLKVLIPDVVEKIMEKEHKPDDLSFFDTIKITDPRVGDLGMKAGQPSPFMLLKECLRRNFGMGPTQCNTTNKTLKNQKCEFSISVGKHSATVVAKNKKEGKQLASQAILSKLHPHIPSWGSLLRLYGTNVEKPVDKVEELNEIKTHVPNKAVLTSLREEMRKLHSQKASIPSMGKMVVAVSDMPAQMSCVDLNSLSVGTC